MAPYYKYDNLPDPDRIAYDHGNPTPLSEIMEHMLQDGSTRRWGSSVSNIFNALAYASCFPSEKEFFATILPIAVRIVQMAAEHQTHGICSPSFQQQVSRFIRKQYPEIRGHRIKEED